MSPSLVFSGRSWSTGWQHAERWCFAMSCMERCAWRTISPPCQCFVFPMHTSWLLWALFSRFPWKSPCCFYKWGEKNGDVWWWNGCFKRVIAALAHLFSTASHIFNSCLATSLPITQGSFQQCPGEGGLANQVLFLRELSLLQGDPAFTSNKFSKSLSSCAQQELQSLPVRGECLQRLAVMCPSLQNPVALGTDGDWRAAGCHHNLWSSPMEDRLQKQLHRGTWKGRALKFLWVILASKRFLPHYLSFC